MDIDVLITGVTGFVGRFVLLEWIETHPDTKISVIIRPAKGKTPFQRFHDEIICDTMFSRHHHALSNVTVIGTSIENIHTTSLLIRSAKCILHSAANVKHYDPYENLVKDNVHNIKQMIRLAETLQCNKLVLLSTCYVHPKDDSTQGTICRIPSTPRDQFYNDYCYTKWLGEEETFQASQHTTVDEIHIVRLSCVGSPLRRDLQSHPYSAQAHLGILSLACRNYISALGLTSNARLSIIPVDMISSYLVDLCQQDTSKKSNEPILHQLCPPKELDTFHPNLQTIFSLAQYEVGIHTLRTYIHDGEHSNYLPFWYSIARFFHKKTDQYVTLHDNVQEFVLLFTSKDIRFDSSIALDKFPTITEHQFLLDTCHYAIRISQHLQFKKGVTLSLMDRFWHHTGNKEPVQACCSLSTPIDVAKKDDLQYRLWSLFCSNRKFTTVIRDNQWVYQPGKQEEYFQVMTFQETDDVTPSLILSKGLQTYHSPHLWHCHLVVVNQQITHLLMQFDHGITDGIGLLPTIVRQSSLYLFDQTPSTNTIPSPHRNLSFFQEILFTSVFVGILLIALLFYPAYQPSSYVSIPSISTETIPLKKHERLTFTGHLLWKLSKVIASHTKQKQMIICVPSVFSKNRSSNSILQNQFVPILLPLHSDMTEEECKNRCLLLQSKLVLCLMYGMQQLISYQEWWWLRDKLMSNVTAIVSSINMGDNLPSMFSGVHVATTTPSPIPFCVTAVSNQQSTFYTVRSHDANVSAQTILLDLTKEK
jgi:hypothetical protein